MNLSSALPGLRVSVLATSNLGYFIGWGLCAWHAEAPPTSLGKCDRVVRRSSDSWDHLAWSTTQSVSRPLWFPLWFLLCPLYEQLPMLPSFRLIPNMYLCSKWVLGHQTIIPKRMIDSAHESPITITPIINSVIQRKLLFRWLRASKNGFWHRLPCFRWSPGWDANASSNQISTNTIIRHLSRRSRCFPWWEPSEAWHPLVFSVATPFFYWFRSEYMSEALIGDYQERYPVAQMVKARTATSGTRYCLQYLDDNPV